MMDKIPVKNTDPTEPSSVGQAHPESFNLYQKHEKIYTRKIEGFYQRLRLFTGWPLLIGYFALPWISWDGRQSVLFDLPNRQFYIFDITFWPQDFMLLAWLLIIAAFGLFFVTTWLGRIWCGYTCPQTVWTSIFMWAEQITEGDRNARVKLDRLPWSINKVVRKTLKHGIWLGVSLLTAFSFVGYFTPIKELVTNMFVFALGPWEIFWLLFFTIATYGNAGWLREQVCMYMCPYARFQAAMFDQDTLIVSYDPKRGENRGSRKKGVDYREKGLGDCIDCQLCVQVCPTGIDIRDGLQYECINCALCIDACNSMMDKMEYPRGLIRYTTEHKLEHESGSILRPKLIGYGLALMLMTLMFAYTISTRTPLELDIIRDRNQLYRETAEGLVENTYTLKVLNMSQQSMRYRISVQGMEELKIKGKTEIEVSAGEILAIPLRVEIDPALLENINVPIEFSVTTLDQSIKVSEQTRFLGPQIR
ncbi:MAG: cytochrome c oxidase accessory protein CcoG [Pseudomonadales bacterium]|nr:cytochrome c oxidase accessory protein CcoG [Pseudomonadales bacterium]